VWTCSSASLSEQRHPTTPPAFRLQLPLLLCHTHGYKRSAPPWSAPPPPPPPLYSTPPPTYAQGPPRAMPDTTPPAAQHRLKLTSAISTTEESPVPAASGHSPVQLPPRRPPPRPCGARRPSPRWPQLLLCATTVAPHCSDCAAVGSPIPVSTSSFVPKSQPPS
jgi:hypothetical protein